ncbi:MAG: SHOCT domain-containing protein [Rubrobacteraceae bacterium]
MGLALLGVLGMISSVFLPRFEETSFSLAGVVENTLQRRGEPVAPSGPGPGRGSSGNIGSLPSTTNPIDDLERLKLLREEGVLTDQQFEAQKNRVLREGET